MPDDRLERFRGALQPWRDCCDDHVEVALIPTTLDLTTLGGKAVGDRVNVEVDVLGKYVHRMTTLNPGENR